jgi:hypothetical protein
MAVVARIIGYSLLTAGLGAVLGLVLFSQLPDHERNGLSFVVACLGTIVGGVAGAAGEIVTAQHRLAESTHRKQRSTAFEGVDENATGSAHRVLMHRRSSTTPLVPSSPSRSGSRSPNTRRPGLSP